MRLFKPRENVMKTAIVLAAAAAFIASTSLALAFYAPSRHDVSSVQLAQGKMEEKKDTMMKDDKMKKDTMKDDMKKKDDTMKKDTMKK